MGQLSHFFIAIKIIIMKQAKIKQIRDLILPLLDSQQVDLIDLDLKGRSGSHVLRIYVDTDEGISLDQCAALSRQISDLLDTRDLISDRYRLEVSSPGLDRPLKTERDFKRNLGRTAKVIYIEKEEEKTLTGIIEHVDNNQVLFNQNKNQIKIEISTILVAKIIPKW